MVCMDFLPSICNNNNNISNNNNNISCCCEGWTEPKLMLMLGSNARSPSCQSFTDEEKDNHAECLSLVESVATVYF